MGDKGARQSSAGAETAERLVHDLAPLGSVTSKKMFGGYGVFDEGIMFALVDSDGAAFLRADDSTAASFDQAGSAAHGRMPYRRIPDAVIAEPATLLDWARKARDVAVAARK